jgi:hypothetical protein
VAQCQPNQAGGSQNTGGTVEVRTSGVQQDVASGTAGGFIERQPVTVPRLSFVVREAWEYMQKARDAIGAEELLAPILEMCARCQAVINAQDIQKY